MSIHRNCEGITRRDCLPLGLGTLTCGLGLSNLLCLSAQAAGRPNGPSRPATNCILIWMDGGPSHFETFDPKPEAPAEIRGEFKPIPTKIRGAQFAEVVPRLAAISDK